MLLVRLWKTELHGGWVLCFLCLPTHHLPILCLPTHHVPDCERRGRGERERGGAKGREEGRKGEGGRGVSKTGREGQGVEKASLITAVRMGGWEER
eukprot:1817304-Rhodomonas_salina.1